MQYTYSTAVKSSKWKEAAVAYRDNHATNVADARVIESPQQWNIQLERLAKFISAARTAESIYNSAQPEVSVMLNFLLLKGFRSLHNDAQPGGHVMQKLQQLHGLQNHRHSASPERSVMLKLLLMRGLYNHPHIAPPGRKRNVCILRIYAKL